MPEGVIDDVGDIKPVGVTVFDEDRVAVIDLEGVRLGVRLSLELTEGDKEAEGEVEGEIDVD